MYRSEHFYKAVTAVAEEIQSYRLDNRDITVNNIVQFCKSNGKFYLSVRTKLFVLLLPQLLLQKYWQNLPIRTENVQCTVNQFKRSSGTNC